MAKPVFDNWHGYWLHGITIVNKIIYYISGVLIFWDCQVNNVASRSWLENLCILQKVWKLWYIGRHGYWKCEKWHNARRPGNRFRVHLGDNVLFSSLITEKLSMKFNEFWAGPMTTRWVMLFPLVGFKTDDFFYEILQILMCHTRWSYEMPKLVTFSERPEPSLESRSGKTCFWYSTW